MHLEGPVCRRPNLTQSQSSAADRESGAVRYLAIGARQPAAGELRDLGSGFKFKDERYFLHVNARFSLSLPRELAGAGEPVFRLREQLLNHLIYAVHCYGLR